MAALGLIIFFAKVAMDLQIFCIGREIKLQHKIKTIGFLSDC